MNIILMGLAGGLGAVLRFMADSEIRRHVHAVLPVGTLLINIVGSFLLGISTALMVRNGIDPDIRLVLGTGLLGGFTSFSTASVETVRLMLTGQGWTAVFNVVVGSLLCVLAAALGYWIG